MISCTVEFTEYELYDVGDQQQQTIGTVHHSMFYVSDRKCNTIHRIHCTWGPNGEYAVENLPQKYPSPRDCAGKGFEITLTKTVTEAMTGAEFASILSKLKPPVFGEGGCQWWILTNLIIMEEHGYVTPGTLLSLLGDKRMDSSKLMEFENLRDMIQNDHPNPVAADIQCLCSALKSFVMEAEYYIHERMEIDVEDSDEKLDFDVEEIDERMEIDS